MMPRGAWRVSAFRTFTEKSIKFATCRPTSRMEITLIWQKTTGWQELPPTARRLADREKNQHESQKSFAHL